jgi:glycosyltransferase involved in cell wall biosynthesis
MSYVVQVSSSDINGGGSSRAAYRLHKGLRNHHIDSAMLVQSKDSDDFTIYGPDSTWSKAVAKIRPHIDRLPKMFYPQRQNTPWSLGWGITDTNARIDKLQPRIVNLHGIGGGFLSIWNIGRIHAPVLWTLHDSGAFTGGCHIPFDCLRYRDRCGKCPQLGSESRSDLSNMIWRLKCHVYGKKEIVVVAPSQWLKKCAKESSLFADHQVRVIPNGIDAGVYKPVNKYFARQALGLSPEDKIILFGAMSSTSDRNKGFQYLQPALSMLPSIYDNNKVKLLVFGASEPKSPVEFGYPSSYMGRLHDDVSLALLYSAADVMVVPSQQESFGQTASEAMSCGTPVVAFAGSGLTDIVDHKLNGYLATPFEPAEIAQGIAWVLENNERWLLLSENARQKILSHFDINIVARQYINLYEEVEQQHKR